MNWLNATHLGDCRELLKDMAADGVQVQMCVTSPPYFGLRDYGTAKWEGGTADCDHLQRLCGTGASTLGEASGGNPMSDAARERSTTRSFVPFRDRCGKCGARRVDSQIGLEGSPGEYVDQLVQIFGLVRNVLSSDGTLWLNLGDSYATQTGKGNNVPQTKWKTNTYPEHAAHRSNKMDVPAKNLLGIPWRVAFALQADGWYLRSDIIWSKPNPMPESVMDRPTKSHEYLFLLAKSERYFCNMEAIKEPAKYPGDLGFLRGPIEGCDSDTVAWRAKSQQDRKLAGVDSKTAGTEFRNRRSVWTIPSSAFSGAHFACFPPQLIEPCILAGARPGDIVLDPFMGSGTTAQVATDLGRNFIGCELNPRYIGLHDLRKTTIGMPF